jgi:tetratricopeptide (TPR) repeat protein
VVDYFQVFGVKRNASDREIKAAYRALAKKHHPDQHHDDPEAERHMQEINEAKAVLFDPALREEHRVTLRMRESFSAEHIEELRRSSRFQGTTTYKPPPEPRRPRSKWDKRWKHYTFGIIAALVLGAVGIITYEIISAPRGFDADPIEDIIERYRTLPQKPVADSLDDIQDAFAFPVDSAAKLRQLGDVMFGAGEFRSASRLYDAYLKKAPPNDTVVGELAYALFRQGKYIETMETISHKMHTDSNLVAAYYNIGKLFLKEEKPFDARDAFRASLHIADSMSHMGRHPPDDARSAREELEKIP